MNKLDEKILWWSFVFFTVQNLATAIVQDWTWWLISYGALGLIFSIATYKVSHEDFEDDMEEDDNVPF